MELFTSVVNNVDKNASRPGRSFSRYTKPLERAHAHRLARKPGRLPVRSHNFGDDNRLMVNQKRAREKSEIRCRTDIAVYLTQVRH